MIFFFLRILLIPVFILLFDTSANAIEEPWSVSEKSPTFGTMQSDLRRKYFRPENRIDPLTILIKGFQEFISPVDGERCTMYPTCSAYGIRAIRKHGALMGFVLTADRIMREFDEHRYAPLVRKHGVLRFYDPVESNDFWWHQ